MYGENGTARSSLAAAIEWYFPAISSCSRRKAAITHPPPRRWERPYRPSWQIGTTASSVQLRAARTNEAAIERPRADVSTARANEDRGLRRQSRARVDRASKFLGPRAIDELRPICEARSELKLSSADAVGEGQAMLASIVAQKSSRGRRPRTREAREACRGSHHKRRSRTMPIRRLSLI